MLDYCTGMHLVEYYISRLDLVKEYNEINMKIYFNIDSAFLQLFMEKCVMRVIECLYYVIILILD